MAPVRWASAHYCGGRNYADHAAEMARRMNRPPEPDPHTQGLKAWHFIKAARTLADPSATVKISGYSSEMDWEVELAAVFCYTDINNPPEEASGFLYRQSSPKQLQARQRWL